MRRSEGLCGCFVGGFSRCASTVLAPTSERKCRGVLPSLSAVFVRLVFILGPFRGRWIVIGLGLWLLGGAGFVDFVDLNLLVVYEVYYYQIP